jgi:hypothetical protein
MLLMQNDKLPTLFYPLHSRELGKAPAIGISRAGKGRDKTLKTSSLPDLTEQVRLLSKVTDPSRTKETKFAHLEVLGVLNRLSEQVLKSQAICSYIRPWIEGKYDNALELESGKYLKSFNESSNDFVVCVIPAQDTVFASAIEPRKVRFLGEDFIISPYDFHILLSKGFDLHEKPSIEINYDTSFILLGQNNQSLNFIFTPRINEFGELLVNQATMMRKSKVSNDSCELYVVGSTFADLPTYENSSLTNVSVEQVAI